MPAVRRARRRHGVTSARRSGRRERASGTRAPSSSCSHGGAAACSVGIASSPSVTASSMAGRASRGRSLVDATRSWPNSKRWQPLAPLHQPHNVAAINAVAANGASVAAGGVLRYRVSPHPAARRPGVRAAAALRRRGGPPLRVSRVVLRIRGLGAVTRHRCSRRRRPHGGRAPG